MIDGEHECGISEGIVIIQPRGSMTADRFLDLSERVADLPGFHGSLPLLWDLTQATPGKMGQISELAAAGWGSPDREYRVFRGPSSDAAITWLREETR